MAKKRSSILNIGGEQAEADPLREESFYESAVYNAISSRTDPHCFLIGRTGSGKSAALQHLEEASPDHVIRINPEDLSLPYIMDLGVVRRLTDLGVHMDPFFIALWKHVFLVELIRHRYKVDSVVAKQNFLASLLEKVKRDSSKRAALEYLSEFGERFWCETDERVREITQKLEEQVGLEAAGQMTLPGVGQAGAKGSSQAVTSLEVRSEQADRFQRVVNATQLPRLNKMIAVLDEDILDSPNMFTYVLIDDLDRDWVDEALANDLVRCLFRAVIDLQKVRHLKVIVALRTNIFQHLKFGSRSGGQEEKFRSLAIHVRWNREDLTELLDQRVQVATSDGESSGLANVKEMLPPRARAGHSGLDYILDRTLLRPRDAIAFLNECLRSTSGKTKFSWEDIYRSEAAYSINRLLALRDEWKPSYPGIDTVLNIFRATSGSMDRDGLTDLLLQAGLLLTEPSFEGNVWMTELTESIWSGRSDSSWIEQYQALVCLLYGIGFIGCVVGDTKAATYSYEDEHFAEQPSNLDATTRFVVHPAFHAALDLHSPRRKRSHRPAADDG